MWKIISIVLLIIIGIQAFFYLLRLRKDKRELKEIHVLTSFIGLCFFWIPKYFTDNHSLLDIFIILGAVSFIGGVFLSRYFKKKFPETEWEQKRTHYFKWVLFINLKIIEQPYHRQHGIGNQ